MNTAVTVSSVWTYGGPSGEQLTNSSHITVIDMLHSSPYTSVVLFDQVDGTDSGEYWYRITFSQADSNVPARLVITRIQLTVTGTIIHEYYVYKPSY